jgi:diguanylate cyclase (GGDEF)-like protein/PAS domain S-box-containing protein
MATRRKRAPATKSRDIAQQKRGEQLLRLQQAVTRSMAEASGPVDGVERALQAICESESWDLGQFWRLDPAGRVMRRFAYWAMPGVTPAQRFADASREVEVPEGAGLVGAAWRSSEPLWIPDLTKDARARRKALAEETGLRAALLCPVSFDGGVIGVLSFACCEIRPPDQDLLRALMAVTTQLGLFLRRVDSEAQLRESEERFRRTFELAGVGVALIGLDRRFQRVNRRFAEILGYAEEELVGRTGRELSHPDDMDHMNAQRPRLYAGEVDAVRGEKRYLRKDGSVVWVAYTLAVERDAAGRPHHEIAVYDDVSARKAAETALRESEARFRSLTELSSDWFWEQDADYRFTRVEGRYAGGAAGAREQVIGTRCWDGELQVEGGWDAYRALLDARRPFHGVLMWRRLPDGRTRYVSISGEPVFGAAGAFVGYRGVGSDVTDRKRAEQLLQLEHQVARALSEADDAAGGLRAVMRAVCRSEGWACGRYFTLDGAREIMVFEHEWSLDDPAVQDFVARSAGLTYRRGQGLVGLAWQGGEPVWSSDIPKDARSLARPLAAQAGIRGAFAFPVKSESQVIGVLAFSSREPREPDERLRQATPVIGAEVGQFLRRMRAEENMRRFRAGMDSSADMILLIDVLSMRYVDVNTTACTLLGYSRQELLALGPPDVLPMSREELSAAYQALVASPSTLGTVSSHYICKDGSHLPFESTRRVLRSAGRPIIVAISRDIRERIAAEEALRESEARFRALTEMSSDFYWETDARHHLTDMTYGRGAVGKIDEALGQAAWDLPSTHPDEAGWAALRRKVDAHQPFRDFEFGRPRSDGGVRYFSVSGEPRFGSEGGFLGYRGVGRDITDVVLARERIASLAFQDVLTGLANRASLAPALEQAVERTRRRGSKLAGVFLDLDGFKQINDLHGHDAGDRLLVEAAHRLRAALRSGDPVARLGGDEFFVVLEDLQSNAPAERVAAKLLAALERPYDLGNGREARISASIGISIYPDDAGDAATLMKHADTAMYGAKQAGKNAYRFFMAGPAANDGRAAGEGRSGS